MGELGKLVDQLDDLRDLPSWLSGEFGQFFPKSYIRGPSQSDCPPHTSPHIGATNRLRLVPMSNFVSELDQAPHMGLKILKIAWPVPLLDMRKKIDITSKQQLIRL